MARETIVRRKLSGDKDVFNLDPPCAYCEGMADIRNIVTIKERYQKKQWVHDVLYNKFRLKTVHTGEDSPAFGEVEINLTYCDKHLKEPLKLRYLDEAIIIVGLISVIIVIFLYFNYARNIGEGNLRDLYYTMIGFGLGVVVLSSLFFFRRYIFKQCKEVYHYPTTNGHYGVETSVEVDPGKEEKGPVVYELVIKFSNKDTAQRFIEKYPE